MFKKIMCLGFAAIMLPLTVTPINLNEKSKTEVGESTRKAPESYSHTQEEMNELISRARMLGIELNGTESYFEILKLITESTL